MTTAGVVLGGGRWPHAARATALLDWHGAPLVAHVAAIVAAAVDGPVVIVGAPGQPLPPLAHGVHVTADPAEGAGPLQGLAAGLAAVAGEAEVAYVAAADLPFLAPAFVRRVAGALARDTAADVALPVVHGHQRPLAAAYRTSLRPVVAALVAERRLQPAALLAHCRVRWLDEAALLGDPDVARQDPHLDSVTDLPTPADYAAALARRRPATPEWLRPDRG